MGRQRRLVRRPSPAEHRRAGVLVQAGVVSLLFALLIRPARRARLMQLWAGGAAFTARLFVLRASH